MNQADAAAVDRWIVDAASTTGLVSPEELQRVLVFVAGVGFDLAARERVRGRLAGVTWGGRTLKGSDTLTPAEVHFLWHVVQRQEWPAGTGLGGYRESLQQVILDPTSGVFTNRYQDAWQFGVARQSRELRGPRGYDWVLVQYRVGFGHWVTGYQPEAGLRELRKPQWSDVRWLRRPRRNSVPRDPSTRST